MAIDNHFLLKKVLQKDQLIAAFCGSTNMPFVYCDPVTYEDQVWVFSDEAGLREFAERFAGKKIPMRGVSIKKNAYPGFFASLLPMGITQVVFTENGANAAIPLDQFVKRQDLSSIPAARRPLENPALQLTALYLMQEARRQVPNEEKEDLQSLNEEFLVNLARSRFMMPVEIKNGPGTPGEKLKNGQVGFVNLNMKNGDTYRPIFSDAYEFNKFKQKKNLQSLMLPFAGLKQAMPKNVKGYILNPAGCSIVILPQLIDQVLQNFQEEVRKGAEEARKIAESQAGPIAGKPVSRPSGNDARPKVTQMPPRA